MSTKKITGGQLRKIIESEVRTVREGMAPSREEQEKINPDPKAGKKRIQKILDKLDPETMDFPMSNPLAQKFRTAAISFMNRRIADELGVSRQEVADHSEDSDAEYEFAMGLSSLMNDYIGSLIDTMDARNRGPRR